MRLHPDRAARSPRSCAGVARRERRRLRADVIPQTAVFVTLLFGLLANGACSPPEEVHAVDAEVVPNDPVSWPLKPTLDPTAFRTSAACQGCHAEHVRQWKLSRHAFAMRDPVFRRLVAVRNEARKNREDGFCTQCHSTIGTRGGECVEGFEFDTLSPVVQEGVTCEACHKVTEVVRTHNAGHKLDAAVAIGGPIANPKANGFHESRHEPVLSESRFCGSCHDVNETSGLPLERAYAEWQSSPAKGTDQTCQHCHMPASKGKAAVNGPQRTVHSHLFHGVEGPVGPGVKLSPKDQAEIDAAVHGLLSKAADLALEVSESVAAGKQLDLVLSVRNNIVGHNFPTGTTFVRQVWVAVEVVDAAGKVLYVSGDLDNNGDLRDHWSELDPYGDSDLISLSSRFVDANGNRTLFTWEAVEHTSDAIEPLKSRTWTLFVPVPPSAKGPLKVRSRLRFRAYGPFLLRLLGLGDLVSYFPIFDIDEANAVVTLQ